MGTLLCEDRTQRYRPKKCSMAHEGGIMATKPDHMVKVVQCSKRLESLASEQNRCRYGPFSHFLQLSLNNTVTKLSLVCIGLNSP